MIRSLKPRENRFCAPVEYAQSVQPYLKTKFNTSNLDSTKLAKDVEALPEGFRKMFAEILLSGYLEVKNKYLKVIGSRNAMLSKSAYYKFMEREAIAKTELNKALKDLKAVLYEEKSAK